MRFLMVFLFSSLMYNSNFGQDMESPDLAFYADVMINADDALHRIYASDKFHQGFAKEISNGDMSTDFSKYKWISIQSPDDNSFRIISWQLVKSDGQYEYFTFYQDDQQTKELNSNLSYSRDLCYEILGFDNYFGGLVYKIDQVSQDAMTQYLVYSMHQVSEDYKVKSVFVMNESGIVVKPFITDANSIRSRDKSIISIKYSATANASINYNSEMNTIVYDHITATIPNSNDSKTYLIPDGSFEGYVYQSGKGWIYNENPFLEIEKELLKSPQRNNSERKSRRRKK